MPLFFNLVTSVEMFVLYKLLLLRIDTVTRVQIIDETGCISHSAIIVGKGIHPDIISLAIGK